MGSVADEFTLLLGFGDEPGANRIKTRPIGLSTPEGDLLIGLDAEGGRHLLVPVGDLAVAEDRQSQRVVVVERALVDEQQHAVRFADLWCQDPSLARVFEQLVEDVVVRLRAGAVAPNCVCQLAIDDWRDLLKSRPGVISREKALGLFGELKVLELLALASPLGAIECWVGPEGASQDFVRSADALEVKTTSTVDGNSIRVSSIDQLDPSSLETLHLVVVHVREDDRARGLDEQIEHLLSMGVPRRRLLASVERAGYALGGGSEFRFETRTFRVWRVDDGFPSLRVADIDPSRRIAISGITYELALPADPLAVGDDAVETLLREWVLR